MRCRGWWRRTAQRAPTRARTQPGRFLYASRATSRKGYGVLRTRPGSRSAKSLDRGHYLGVTKRLLIVDDDARFRKLLRMVLEDAPEFDVVGEAHEGASALTAARDRAQDVVLLDVNLPDTTGFELAPLLKAETAGTDVVLTSSRGDDTYVQLAHEAGGKAFISKHDLSAEAILRALA